LKPFAAPEAFSNLPWDVQMSEFASLERQAELLPRPRAGFWRRLSAFIIDTIIVSLPIQILVVVLFALTNGAVQTTSGISFGNCLKTLQITELPQGLDPPPPANSNQAVICSTSFFGLESARRLTVSRVTKEGIVTKTFSRTYALDAQGKPRNAVSLDSVAVLALFIYLITMEYRFGATLGKCLLGIRVADADGPERLGIPLRKAGIRNLLMWAWAVPLFAVLLVFLIVSHGDWELLMEDSFFVWFWLAGIPVFAWHLWVLVQIVCKLDPIYDKIAGTAVLRV
jgi:uncharacterized RDD family membrane protein YckC